MNIRLTDEILTIPVRDIRMSEMLLSMHENVDLMDLLNGSLDKCDFKRVRDIMGSILPDTVSELDSESVKQQLKQICKDSDSATAAILDNIYMNFDDIFTLTAHQFPRIPDETMRQVVTFLTIECPDSVKSSSMFDHLPMVIQNNKTNKPLQNLLKKELHPFIPFMESIDDDLLKLGAAATYLDIRPLTYLVGSLIGYKIANTPESQIRNMYKVPPKFQSAVIAEQQRITSEYDWSALTKK